MKSRRGVKEISASAQRSRKFVSGKNGPFAFSASRIYLERQFLTAEKLFAAGLSIFFENLPRRGSLKLHYEAEEFSGKTLPPKLLTRGALDWFMLYNKKT
jgi:hypothetical protein